MVDNIMFRWEPLKYLLTTGLNELAQRHWDEAGYDKETLKFNPDWERYQRMEDETICRWMAIRSEEILVGYASIIITHSLHDKDVCCAIVQDFYVAPKHRGFLGVKLFWVLETQLIPLKVRHIAAAERIMTTNEERSRVGKLFEHLGFHSDERIWTKSIGVAA